MSSSSPLLSSSLPNASLNSLFLGRKSTAIDLHRQTPKREVEVNRRFGRDLQNMCVKPFAKQQRSLEISPLSLRFVLCHECLLLSFLSFKIFFEFILLGLSFLAIWILLLLFVYHFFLRRLYLFSNIPSKWYMKYFSFLFSLSLPLFSFLEHLALRL